MDPEGASTPGEERRTQQQVDNAIRAIREKKPLPEIDFSIHTMEDGTQVNTMERVCKGIPYVPLVGTAFIAAAAMSLAILPSIC
ncbi:hypothetical protein CH063_03304 [Colletotrichum higginsianum]|uniref:Uncharacterized protein n=1 Tax=Colletotrichum higginsianum (strain IMI 349063) TaxID=759273 RepID=H1VVS1_COLHI|nr:hypothetical protein CH063_03304 [Colletotrichum higginsianum]